MCGCDEKTSSSESLISTPMINEFVIYAERSISLGSCNAVVDGNLGVHSITEGSFGNQLTVGSHSRVERTHNLFSPSVALGKNVSIGMIQTNELHDNGIRLGPIAAFPASAMPPLPQVPFPAGGGTDFFVASGQVVAMQPGVYGALTVWGTCLLNPGSYCFTSVTLADDSRVIAIAGDVKIAILEDFTTGRRVRVYPAFHKTADELTITVSGSGDKRSRPAVSIGERSAIRALVAAPHGTISIADHVHAMGAFAGFDIGLGEHVHVKFQCGFPVDAPDQKGSQPLQGYYGVHPDPKVAPVVGTVPYDTNIALAIGLPVRDPQGLKGFIKQVSDPKSPLFRKHLTQQQFTATYGATDADFQTLKEWATTHGFSIYAPYSNNLLLGVTATAAQIEAALYVNLVYRQRSDGSPFVAVDREPSIDLSVPLLRITGLTEFRIPQRAGGPLPFVCGTGTPAVPGSSVCGASYRAADIRNAYLGDAPDLLNELDGKGQVVGLLELNSYDPNDIAAYDARQIPPIDPTNVELYTIAAPPPFTSYQNDLEVALDIEMVQAIAPGAKILVFQTALGLTLHGDAVLHAMATANPPLTSASCSYNFGRSDNSEQALDQMAATGVSFFTASGDYGDIGDPQSNLDMLSQTLVGGTFLSTNSLNAVVPTPSYPNPYYAGETAWNQQNTPTSKGVTGGGIMDGKNHNGQCYCWPYTVLGLSSCCGNGVAIPDWQIGIMQTSAAANGGSKEWRNYPDVAMLADNIEMYYGGQVITRAWGTSAAAPLWAGFMALVNQRIKSIDPNAGLSGFLNPTLYDIGLTSGLADDLYKVCFNDVVGGGNANGFGNGFQSVTGYDLCTGLGTPTSGLVYQLSSPNPTTNDQPLDLIRFVIGTGKDNLRGNGGFLSGIRGTGCTADILFRGYDLTSGVGVMTVTLKPKGGDEEFANNSTTPPIDFAISKDNAGNKLRSPTRSNGIVGVRINIQQDYSPPATADNWDIASISVSLFNPPFSASTSVCQLNLIGSSHLQDGSVGLVRLSESAGGSGVGPSTQIYYTGPGSGCS